jgi:hypothetical protein
VLGIIFGFSNSFLSVYVFVISVTLIIFIKLIFYLP